MEEKKEWNRRRFLIGSLLGVASLSMAGCDALSQNKIFAKVLKKAEKLTQKVQRAIAPRKAMAKEFTEADLSPKFPSNGNTFPEDSLYQRHLKENFKNWRLEIDGLVERPLSLSLEEIKQFPSRTQITRHDCVEGWSAIGKWKGVKLGELLEKAGVLPNARYVVFHCADRDEDEVLYYESIDLEDAFHPQTILVVSP